MKLDKSSGLLAAVSAAFVVVMVGIVVAATRSGSENAPVDRVRPTASGESVAEIDPGDGDVTKLLIADGSHWGCPGTYCGPDVSRLDAPSFNDAAKRVVAKGTEVVGRCVKTGEPITDPVRGTVTDLWVLTDQPDDLVWMSAHYFGTTDFATVVEGLPGC